MVHLPDPTLRPVLKPYSTLRAIAALMLREMTTTYGRSPGGYIWAILEPAAGIAVLTAFFSAGFRDPPLGTSFALFYAGGILTFLLYADIQNKMAGAIQFSRALLEYPRITFLDAMLARLFLTVLTQMVVHFIVAGTIVTFIAPHSILDFKMIGLTYLLTIALGAGVGTMNSFLILAYPVWQNIWAITTRPLFLISGLFFTFESVPQPYSDYLWFNPIIHLVGMMRDGYFPFYKPIYTSVAYVLIVAGVTFLSGLFLLHRYHRDILLK
jgi:capsular polysaccharide transport system permease protein